MQIYKLIELCAIAQKNKLGLRIERNKIKKWQSVCLQAMKSRQAYKKNLTIKSYFFNTRKRILTLYTRIKGQDCPIQIKYKPVTGFIVMDNEDKLSITNIKYIESCLMYSIGYDSEAKYSMLPGFLEFYLAYKIRQEKKNYPIMKLPKQKPDHFSTRYIRVYCEKNKPPFWMVEYENSTILKSE